MNITVRGKLTLLIGSIFVLLFIVFSLSYHWQTQSYNRLTRLNHALYRVALKADNLGYLYEKAVFVHDDQLYERTEHSVRRIEALLHPEDVEFPEILDDLSRVLTDYYNDLREAYADFEAGLVQDDHSAPAETWSENSPYVRRIREVQEEMQVFLNEQMRISTEDHGGLWARRILSAGGVLIGVMLLYAFYFFIPANVTRPMEDHIRQLEEIRAYLEETDKKTKLELEKARKLHRRLLPEPLPCPPGLEISAYYRPAEWLGGDYYGVIHDRQQQSSWFLVYLVDVAGHGLDGALLSIFVRESINGYMRSFVANDIPSPSRIVKYVLSRYIEENMPDDSLICLMVGVMDLSSFEFSFCNAGFHVPQFHITASGHTDQLCGGGLPLSNMSKELDYLYSDQTITVSPKEGLFLSTDGLFEQSYGGKQFGEERVADVLRECWSDDVSRVRSRLSDGFAEFLEDDAAQDDVTFLIIKRLGT